MEFLGKKRNFVTSKLTFKSKNKITPIIYKEKQKNEDNDDDNNNDIKSTNPLQEENNEKTIFKEFISEKDLKRGLNPQQAYSKLSKIEPLPKEYKVYKKGKLTKFEKKHLKKIENDKKKLTSQQKMDKWNFDSNYDKYQKLLTSLPEFNEMPRISGV